MKNKFISCLMSVLLIANTSFAQDFPEANDFDLTDADMVWVPQEKKITVGKLEIKVWILPVGGLISPDSGYVVKRGDFGQIKQRMDGASSEIERVIGEERKACNTELEEKDKSCLRVTQDLRDLADTQTNKIKKLNIKIGELDDTIFYWRFGAITAATLAFSFGLFAISK